VRLLQSHCNQERATKQLGSLVRRAWNEDVERSAANTPRKAPKRLSAEINAQIVADYQSGMKATDVARKHGINEWTVRHRLRRSGVPLRPISMNEDEIELTFVLRAQGLSYERIAERVGFSEGTVRNVLRRKQR
jgi:DNA-directed RNA polymerase specialized sigma24 family protein